MRWSQRGHKWRHNMAQTRCMLDKQGYTYACACTRPLDRAPTHSRGRAHRQTCNTYCFSMVKMVTRTRLNVTYSILWSCNTATTRVCNALQHVVANVSCYKHMSVIVSLLSVHSRSLCHYYLCTRGCSVTAICALAVAVSLLSVHSRLQCHYYLCTRGCSVTAICALAVIVSLLSVHSRSLCHCYLCTRGHCVTAICALAVVVSLLSVHSRSLCHCYLCTRLHFSLVLKPRFRPKNKNASLGPYNGHKHEHFLHSSKSSSHTAWCSRSWRRVGVGECWCGGSCSRYNILRSKKFSK
jgi:hypothetical protein